MNENSMSLFKCYATSMECQRTNVVLCTLTMKISTDMIVKPFHVIHQRCYKIRHTRFENISIVLLTKFKKETIMFDFLSKLNIIFDIDVTDSKFRFVCVSIWVGVISQKWSFQHYPDLFITTKQRETHLCTYIKTIFRVYV